MSQVVSQSTSKTLEGRRATFRVRETIAEREGVCTDVHPSHTNRAGGRHNLFTHFPKDTNCRVCRRSKVTTAPCTRNSDDRADRIKVAERFGDKITADHKILTEEQEARMHHKYAAVVVQDLAAPYSKLPMQNQISSGGAKHSSKIVTSRRKTQDPLVRTIVCFFKRAKG